MQEPVTIDLGTSYVYQKHGAKRRLIEKKDTFQYVPLLENLQAFSAEQGGIQTGM